MTQTTDPYKVELLDLWNEVGGQMIIKFHRATITPAKEDLQKLRDNDWTTDVLSVAMQALLGHGMSEEEVLAFFQEAKEAGATPRVSFNAGKGETLNISSKENNPMVDSLVQAIRACH